MIRQATIKDYKRIAIALSNKNPIDYLTKSHVKKDITTNSCYILEQDNKIVAICSLIFDNDFQMYYLKRLLILNKKNQSKGYATTIMKELSEKVDKIAITPFQTNKSMIELVKRLGFKYQYTFLENYCYFIKERK